LLEAWQHAVERGLNCALLIVPRHAERRTEIEALLTAAKVSFHFRSRGPAPSSVNVSVADTTGELRRLTQLADLVFVGKSLPPNEGGQTPVEAAALEKPVLFGPNMSNFRVIAAELVASGAAHQVADAESLKTEILTLLTDSSRRQALAVAAGAWHRSNAGAVDRTIAIIREELGRLR
jgi:3-deoxy-D-manno-octulosonic-acid transferase